MKKKSTISLPAIGGSSLLVIFAVLCLTVFSLLSLSTVQAERKLSDKAAESVAAYYDADLQAQKIFARLRFGETVDGVSESKGIYCYECPVSQSQTLLVRLQKQEETWTILQWQTIAQPGQLQNTLTLWNGK